MTRTAWITCTAEEIRDARAQLGLSQARMAECLGMHPDGVRDWERGRAICKGPAALAVRLLLALRQEPPPPVLKQFPLSERDDVKSIWREAGRAIYEGLWG